MRDYAIVSPKIWIGETGRQIRDLGLQAQVVSHYLISAPNSNMIGLYYLSVPTLAHETGIPSAGALKALRSLSEVGFSHYDEASETVWVPRMAAFQIGPRVKREDNRRKAIERELVKYSKSPFYAQFLARYKEAFSLEIAELEQGPLEPLRSQEQDQFRNRVQEQDVCAVPLSGTTPVITITLNDGTEYPISQEHVDEWISLFQGIDVVQQLRLCRAWNLANPKNRKTKGGIMKHIMFWLSLAQNESRRQPADGQRGVSNGPSQVDARAEAERATIRNAAAALV